MQNEVFLDALTESFGPKVTTGATAAETARAALFNHGCRKQPCAIVGCAESSDVQAAVRLATKYEVPLSVLGGGQHWAGFAIAENGLVLDLRQMSKVQVDRHKHSVTFGGGSRINDVLLALPDDLVSVTGTVSVVGYTGLTLGGGYGPLNSMFGLVCDTVRSAEVVLADGSVVTASADSNPDLLWALRGGGGNYGVVTSLELELYALPEVQTATIALPLTSAASMLALITRVVQEAPDELSVFSGLVTLPDEKKGMICQPLLCGHSEQGEKLFEDLCTQSGTHVLTRRWCAYKEIFDREAEKVWLGNEHSRVSARFCETISPEVVRILTEGAASAPTPGCSILVHDFKGKAARITPGSAAYPLRKPHFVIEPIAGWNAEADAAPCRNWLDRLLQQLEPLALPGGWANVLGPDEKERVHDFYKPSQERLSAVKKKFDPQNVFFSNVTQP